MMALFVSEAVDARPCERPLALAANEIAGNCCGTFMACYTVGFHIGNDFARIHAAFQKLCFILQDVTPLFFDWNPF
jgi:hypothetical protein